MCVVDVVGGDGDDDDDDDDGDDDDVSVVDDIDDNGAYNEEKDEIPLCYLFCAKFQFSHCKTRVDRYTNIGCYTNSVSRKGVSYNQKFRSILPISIFVM